MNSTFMRCADGGKMQLCSGDGQHFFCSVHCGECSARIQGQMIRDGRSTYSGKLEVSPQEEAKQIHVMA